ncbi:flagellin [Natronolimnobius baerhuensis]|uniref:Flagellin n=1 Tax=Natronolimnobius baerhuensis TaxID=253108 RepID=A0A202E9U2_9EURY|nr:flagellin [Natronolimnobius baerhuensis]OVE84997.1 flagellin [Natronolimnobius baerhuensis]
MASVPASHIILFVASMIVAAGIAGTVILEVDNLSDAVETRGSNVAEEIETDIEITSDQGYAESIYDPDAGEVTLLVKNIGSSSLDASDSQLDILLDGRYVTSDATTVERVDVEGSSWRSGGVVEVTIDLEQTNGYTVEGDTRVTVIVTGNEDTIAFYAGDNGEEETE